MEFFHPLRFVLLLSSTLLGLVSSYSSEEYPQFQCGTKSEDYNPRPYEFYRPQYPTELKVVYNVNGTPKAVTYGNVFSQDEVKYEPYFTWIADPNKLYTILIFDYDDPFPQWNSFSPMVIGLYINIQGNVFTTAYIVAEYMSPKLLPSSDPHRIIIFLYEQKYEVKYKPQTIPSSQVYGRANTNLNYLEDKYNLYGPIGSNYFCCKRPEF